MIVGKWSRSIFVVDACAGAGSYVDPDTGDELSDGSPAIFARRAKEYTEEYGPGRTMKLICCETAREPSVRRSPPDGEAQRRAPHREAPSHRSHARSVSPAAAARFVSERLADLEEDVDHLQGRSAIRRAWGRGIGHHGRGWVVALKIVTRLFAGPGPGRGLSLNRS